MYCSKCGAENKEDANFCKNCGNQLGGEPTNQTVADEHLVLPASLLQRFLHHIVDSIAMYAFAFVVGFISYFLFGETVASVLGIIAFFLYHLIFEALFQRTIGKIFTGTKVVNIQGEKPSLLALLGRTLARYIPFEPLSFLFYGAYPTKGWHDRLSRTLVVPKSLTAEGVQKIDPEKIREQKRGNTAGTVIVIIVGAFFFIAIIGILSSVVLASLNAAREKAQEASLDASHSTESVYEELKYAEEYANSLYDLPAMIDEETRLDRIYASDNNKINYDYILVNYTADELEWSALENVLVPNIENSFCNDSSFEYYRERNVPMKWNYYGMYEGLIGSIELSSNDCI